MKHHYDPGIDAQEDRWLRLHRNENLFIEKEWLSKLANNVIKSLTLSSYPDSSCSQLRQELGQLYHVDPDQIFIGNGSDEIIADLFHYLRSNYSEMVTLPLTYKVYPFLLQRYGFTQLTKEKASPKHCCIIDSPNSLTGEKFDIKKIPSSFMIWDNVYGEFAHDQPNFKQLDSSTVLLRSFSKFYGLASLRIGYGIADAKVVHELMKRKDIFNVNGFGQAMALQVLEHRDYFEALIPKISQARTALQKELKALGFSLSSSEANFVWATHPSVSAEVIQKHLERAYIAVRRFPDPTIQSYLRITVPPLEQLERVIQVIKQCV